MRWDQQVLLMTPAEVSPKLPPTVRGHLGW